VIEMAKIALLYRIKKFGEDGKLKYDSGLQESHSFVIQFMQHLELMVRGNTSGSAYDINGTERYLASPEVDWLRIGSIMNSSTYGIVCGTGTTAPTNTDYKLESQCTHGTGTNQLLHTGHTFGDTAVVGDNVDYTFGRPFTNQSGSTITVSEIGIYVYSTNYPYYFCIARDVITGVDVEDGESIYVEYTFRTTV